MNDRVQKPKALYQVQGEQSDEQAARKFIPRRLRQMAARTGEDPELLKRRLLHEALWRAGF